LTLAVFHGWGRCGFEFWAHTANAHGVCTRGGGNDREGTGVRMAGTSPRTVAVSAHATGTRYRHTLPVHVTGRSYRLPVQAYPTGIPYRHTLPVQAAEGARYRLPVEALVEALAGDEDSGLGRSVTRDRWLDERRWGAESNVGCGVKSAVTLSLALSAGGVVRWG
jgi:hypothetical protein